MLFDLRSMNDKGWSSVVQVARRLMTEEIMPSHYIDAFGSDRYVNGKLLISRLIPCWSFGDLCEVDRSLQTELMSSRKEHLLM